MTDGTPSSSAPPVDPMAPLKDSSPLKNKGLARDAFNIAVGIKAGLLTGFFINPWLGILVASATPYLVEKTSLFEIAKKAFDKIGSDREKPNKPSDPGGGTAAPVPV